MKNKTQFKSGDNYASNSKNLDDLDVDKLKALNVIFIYNSHTWDAYEVLGIKPGCSFTEIETAFKKAIESNGSESQEFLKTALAAIFQNLKNQGFEPR